jgi:hypothetical protein
MLVCCAHKELASNPSYSDDKCASRSSRVTVAQSGPCPSADVRTAQLGQLYDRAAAHAGCKCAGSGQVGQRTAAAVSQVQPFRVRLVLRNTSPASLDAFVKRECGSSSTTCSLSGGATVEVPNGAHKQRGTVTPAREIHAAAAVRCPTWPLPAHLHPACAAARTYS